MSNMGSSRRHQGEPALADVLTELRTVRAAVNDLAAAYRLGHEHGSRAAERRANLRIVH